MRIGLATILSLACILPGVATAQSFGASDNPTPFTLAARPQYPAPFSTATLTFLSGDLELANATLSVTANGKNIYRGAVQPVPVTLGRAGSVVNIVATISSAGASYSQTLSLQPEDVVLVLEPVSSAPPLYQGKSLVPIGGDVRVVAIANIRNTNGVSVNPASLSYSWTVDGAQIAGSSGIGKTTILVASPLQYRARDVSVTVMSQNGGLGGGASISFSSEEPSVRMYRNDPLLGILFNRALLGSYTITDAEATLYGAPFSFPTTGGSPLLQWFLNGTVAQTGNSITLRPSGNGQGTASLSLTASSGSYTTASENISVNFGAKPSSNFFGL